MQVIQKKILSGLFLSMLFGGVLAPSLVLAANPAALNVDFQGTTDSALVNSFTGFEAGAVANDPRIIIKRFINVVMGFLGMIAVIVILFAGFMWMTAAGDKERLETAHKLLKNGIIGLIIIFSAWTVAWFMVNMLQQNIKAS